MNEKDDVIFKVLQEQLNKFLNVATNAPNEEMRQLALQQVSYIMQDWENYSKADGTVEYKLAPKPECPTVPVVNLRREAILAQRARKTA